jgi:hypothetical protein
MANDGPSGWIGQLKEIWGPLAGAATWIFGIAGSFLLPPPVIANNGQWPNFAKFIIAVCVGLLVVPGFLFRRQKAWIGWEVMAVLFFAVAVGSIFAYQHLTDSTTCTYQGALVVIGKTYTPHGAEYVKENPGISCGDLIDRHVGKIEDVWTKDSIDWARLKLVGTYIACMPLFTICIMSLLQGIYCWTGGRR